MTQPCDPELLSAYLDGELTEPEEISVRVHLSECSDCQAKYAALQRNRKALQRHPQIAPSAESRERLARRLDRELFMVSRRVQAQVRRRTAFALAAAAAVVLLLTGIIAIYTVKSGTARRVKDAEKMPEIQKPRAPRVVKKAPEDPGKEQPDRREIVKSEPVEKAPGQTDKPEIKDTPPDSTVAIAPEKKTPEVKQPVPEPEQLPEKPEPELVEAPGTKLKPDEPTQSPEQEKKEQQYAAAEKKFDKGFAGKNVAMQIEAIRDLAKCDSPKTYRKLRDTIIVEKKKYDVRVRRRGVMACGELATEDGIRIIFQIPSTEETSILDARLDALALIRDRQTLKLLARSLKLKPGDDSIKFASPDGRRLIAITLGNDDTGAAFTVESLLEALRETPIKQIELRSAIINSLGRLRHPAAVAPLNKLLSSTRKDIVRVYQKILSAEALGHIGGKLAREALVTAYKKSPPEAVKIALIRAIGACRASDATGLLMKQTVHSSNTIRSSAFEALGRITGKSYASASEWKKWWKKVKKDYTAPREIELGPPASKAFFRTGNFPLYVENVVYVLDHSASMEKNGKALQLLADTERSINSLDPCAKFGVVCFNERPRLFKQKLVAATHENKRAAIEFCKRWLGKPQSLGYTDAAKALMEALALNPDTIVYASDGLRAGEEKEEEVFPTVTARRFVRELGWADRGRPKLKRPRIYVTGYFVPKGNLSPNARPTGETPRALRILADDTGGLFRFGWFTDMPIIRENKKNGKK